MVLYYKLEVSCYLKWFLVTVILFQICFFQMKVNGRNLALISRLCYPITLLPIVVNENRIILPSDFIHFTKVFCIFKSVLCFSGNQSFFPLFSVAVLIYVALNFWLYYTSLFYFILFIFFLVLVLISSHMILF